MSKSGAELLGKPLRKRKRKTSSDDDGELESFSEIDDALLSRYINSEPEMIFKKLIWESMNKDYGKGKQKPQKPQKQVSRLKKPTSEKTAGRQKETVNEKSSSSKINFAALNDLRNELGMDTEKSKEQITYANSQLSGDDSQRSGNKLSPEEDNSGESPEQDNNEDNSGESPEQDNSEDNSGEFEQDDDYNKDVDGPINYGYGDEEGGYGDYEDYGF